MDKYLTADFIEIGTTENEWKQEGIADLMASLSNLKSSSNLDAISMLAPSFLEADIKSLTVHPLENLCNSLFLIQHFQFHPLKLSHAFNVINEIPNIIIDFLITIHDFINCHLPSCCFPELGYCAKRRTMCYSS